MALLNHEDLKKHASENYLKKHLLKKKLVKIGHNLVNIVKII